jgi:hypothetical protein
MRRAIAAIAVSLQWFRYPMTASTSNGLARFIHVTDTEGHKQPYLDLFGERLGLSPSVGRIGFAKFRKLVAAESVLFGTLDDDVPGFVLVALARAAIGQRTAGIFMRPQYCLNRTFRGRLKRVPFRLLRAIPLVSTLSLLPFAALPGLSQVASHEVHDPQIWDVFETPPVADAVTAERIHAEAAGRRILAVLGTMTAAKGMNFLAEMVRSRPSLTQRYYILVAAQATADCIESARYIDAHGGSWWGRWASDAELRTLYAMSDLIWCRYEPGYDQASGIFGRAIQWGRRAVLRGSAAIVTHYDDLLQIGSVRLDDDPALAADQLLELVVAPAPPAVDLSVRLSQWRTDFFSTIARTTRARGGKA